MDLHARKISQSSTCEGKRGRSLIHTWRIVASFMSFACRKLSREAGSMKLVQTMVSVTNDIWCKFHGKRFARTFSIQATEKWSMSSSFFNLLEATAQNGVRCSQSEQWH